MILVQEVEVSTKLFNRLSIVLAVDMSMVEELKECLMFHNLNICSCLMEIHALNSTKRMFQRDWFLIQHRKIKNKCWQMWIRVFIATQIILFLEPSNTILSSKETIDQKEPRNLAQTIPKIIILLCKISKLNQ